MKKKWRAFGVFCGFYRVKRLGCEILFLAFLGLCLNASKGGIFGPKNDIRVSFYQETIRDNKYNIKSLWAKHLGFGVFFGRNKKATVEKG